MAYATYRKGQKRIAQDIFVLAMEDPSAAKEFGQINPQALESELQSAVNNGDWAKASEALESLKGIGESTAMDEMPMLEGEEGEEELPLDLMDEEEDEDEDMGEGALSPGDEVPPPPAPDLAPAQVGALVALAKRVKAGGHPDLARRITRALGL